MISQQKRKRVEEPFGWGKTIGGLARPMLRGEKKLDFKFTLTMAGLRPHQAATVDRSGGLSDFRPAPKASCHTPKIPIRSRKQTRRPLPQFFSSLLILLSHKNRRLGDSLANRL